MSFTAALLLWLRTPQGYPSPGGGAPAGPHLDLRQPGPIRFRRRHRLFSTYLLSAALIFQHGGG